MRVRKGIFATCILFLAAGILLGAAGCREESGESVREAFTGNWGLIAFADHGTEAVTVSGEVAFDPDGTVAMYGRIGYPGETVDDVAFTGEWMVRHEHLLLIGEGSTEAWIYEFIGNDLVLTGTAGSPPNRMVLSRGPGKPIVGADPGAPAPGLFHGRWRLASITEEHETTAPEELFLHFREDGTVALSGNLGPWGVTGSEGEVLGRWSIRDDRLEFTDYDGPTLWNVELTGDRLVLTGPEGESPTRFELIRAPSDEP